MTPYETAASLLDRPSVSRLKASWPVLRLVLGAAILGLLVWRVGTGPFVDGIRLVTAPAIIAAVVIGAIITLLCAWRWGLVARGLGIQVPMRQAVPAYYRSQFLNVTVPGGVVGDVHRAVQNGRDVGDVSGGVRAVAWERTAGQVVQIVVTVAVLLVLPSPVRSSMPGLALTIAAIAAVLVLVAVLAPRSGRWSAGVNVVRHDIRHGLFAGGAWPLIVIASALAVAGNTAMFVLAAHTAGLSATSAQLLPLALIVLLAMAIPFSIGGWGPREGVAAWAFGLAGLGAAAGITTAVVYGVLVLASTLPGAIVLVVAWLRRA